MKPRGTLVENCSLCTSCINLCGTKHLKANKTVINISSPLTHLDPKIAVLWNHKVFKEEKKIKEKNQQKLELEHCLYISPVPIYTPGWRDGLRKCLAQKHSTMILLSAASGPLGVIETASRCSDVSRWTNFFRELFFTITEILSTFEDNFRR